MEITKMDYKNILLESGKKENDWQSVMNDIEEGDIEYAKKKKKKRKK